MQCNNLFGYHRHPQLDLQTPRRILEHSAGCYYHNTAIVHQIDRAIYLGMAVRYSLVSLMKRAPTVPAAAVAKGLKLLTRSSHVPN